MVPSVFHQYLIETAILLLVVEMQYSNIGVVSLAYSGKYILHWFGKSSGSISQRELVIADTEGKLNSCCYLPLNLLVHFVILKMGLCQVQITVVQS